MKNTCISLLATLATVWQITAQTSFISGNVNFYAAVNGIDYCNNSMTVSNAFPFNVGNKVLIIQMKGAVVDTTNTATFGNVLAYNGAGLYEYATILAKVGSVLTFDKTILNNYNLGQAVQIVKVPVYNNATVNGTLTCSAWNGTTGGVLALEVTGNLTLDANIDVSANGYRPVLSSNFDTCCYSNAYYYPRLTGRGGAKGESFTTLSSDKNGGKGKNANAGGGGNLHNAGGGGGAGLGNGGVSGYASFLGGTNPNASQSAGVGGAGFNYLTNRIFLGGGGGNGQNNDGQNYAGARGAGIVMIKAASLQCNANSILANGQTAQTDSIPSIDGMPGGGGGGTVFLQVGAFTDTLRVQVRGGAGGSNMAGLPYMDGTGGGGGGGAVLLSGSMPPQNSVNLSGGAAGFSLAAGNSYGAAAGQNGGTRTNWVAAQSNIEFVSLNTVTANSNAPVCEGDTLFLVSSDYPGAEYTWSYPNGLVVTEQNPYLVAYPANAGTYILNVTRANCAATIPDTVQVTVTPASYSTQQESICEGEIYILPDGSTATTTGDYLTPLLAANGCDSNVTTVLSVHPIYSQTYYLDLCAGENLTLANGLTVNMTGSYPVTLLSQFGCDSTLITNLTIHDPITVTQADTICWNETFPLPNGTVATQTGEYTSVLTDMFGCDSFVITQLYEYPILLTNIQTYICFGDTYTLPNGQVVATTGVYSSVITASTGCDSTVVTDLTVRLLPTSTTSATICSGETYTLPNGTTANTSGAFPVTLTDIYGCDSIVTTQLLVVPTAYSTTNTYICNGDTYTLPDGSQVSTVGTYQTTLASNWTGCDSIVTTILDVIIVPETTVFDTICQSETISFHGQIFNESGIYTDTLVNFLGCDSITHLDLFVIPLSVSLPDDIEINLGDPVHIVADVQPEGVPLDIILWSPDSLGTCTPQPCFDFDYFPLRSVTATIWLQSTRGCTAQADINIIVNKKRRIFVPNVFTPNGDNLNDQLSVFCGPDVRHIRAFEVFDRWGNKVFSAKNVAPGDAALHWDGTLRGKQLDAAVFIWYVEADFIDNETEIIKGDVTLLK